MNSVSYLDFPSLAEVTVGKGSFQNATDSRFESIYDYSVYTNKIFLILVLSIQVILEK